MRALRMALAVGVAVFLGVPAFAQFGPGGGMRGGAGMLIGNKGVQKELKLGEQQVMVPLKIASPLNKPSIFWRLKRL